VVDVYLSFYLCNFLWFLTNWVLLQRERGCFSPTISSPLYIMIRCRLSNIVTIERKHSARWSCNNYQTHNENKFIIPLPWWINRPTLFRNIHYTGSCNLGRFSNTPTLPRTQPNGCSYGLVFGQLFLVIFDHCYIFVSFLKVGPQFAVGCHI
jgi:hypothetical protein